MAGQQGGYRQPNNPAPVSGPGALSQRTDGGAVDGMQPAQTQAPKYMPGLGYGKGGENMANQQSAPLAGSPTPQMPAPTMPAVPLSAPTMRPNEPITAGVDFGPGPGSEAIQIPNQAMSPSHTIKRIAQADPSGESELLYRALLDRGL
jgi:hypothetical protein